MVGRTQILVALALVLVVGCDDDVPPISDGSPGDAAVEFIVDGARDTAPMDQVPDSDPSSGVGKACTASGPGPQQGTCRAGLICMRETSGFPGGYCTRSCETQACPMDSSCVPLAPLKMCYLTCFTDADCRSPDYTCFKALSACWPAIDSGPPVGTNNGLACVDPTGVDLSTDTRFGTNQNISGGSSIVEAEVSIAASSTRIASAYIASSITGSHIGISTSTDGKTFTRQVDIVDAVTGHQCDPALAVDASDTIHVVWLGLDRTPAGAAINRHLFVSRSDDGGASWSKQIDVTDPADLSPVNIDKPWITIDPAGPIYVTYMSYTGAGASQIKLVRSTDGGKTWSKSTAVSSGNAWANLAQPVVDSSGDLYISWVDVLGDPYGSAASAVQVARSTDKGLSSGQTVRVSGTTEKVVFDVPVPVVDGKNLYVVYVTGETTGAWDVRVARAALPVGAFEPSVLVSPGPACATRFHPWAMIDSGGRLHVAYYDNSYLFGVLRHVQADTPMATTLSFSPPSFVSDASFTFTTRRDVVYWLGDYVGLVGFQGALHAVWADPRKTSYSHIFHAQGSLSGT
jgi:hypothetical protein